MPADHRAGLAQARLLECRARVPIPAPDVMTIDRSGLEALLAYTKALATDGRCTFDVALKNKHGEYAGSSRCVLPVEWDGKAWRHWGPCEPWEGRAARG